ncbi:hypothetical protein HMPREF1557_00737, partial [Streptococcus sobrinus W1703]
GKRYPCSHLNYLLLDSPRTPGLPKGSKNATPQEVAVIENWINNYPKKILDYKSPGEFLQKG